MGIINFSYPDKSFLPGLLLLLLLLLLLIFLIIPTE